jgi:uncharacterized protein (DUF1684 family)
MIDLEEFRQKKDEFFAEDQQSPLTWEQKRNFQGLKYFPEDPKLRFDVEVTKISGDRQIRIPTSTGGSQTYRKYGRFHFTVDGKEAELTIYADDQGYFLPFVDSLAGKETYPAGRYLEPHRLPDGKFHVDFNLAYNPYCAYNERWECPLTPSENRLDIPIRAGEKMFHD